MQQSLFLITPVHETSKNTQNIVGIYDVTLLIFFQNVIQANNAKHHFLTLGQVQEFDTVSLDF